MDCSVLLGTKSPNQAMQPTANFVRILRGRYAPIIAQNAHKVGRV